MLITPKDILIVGDSFCHHRSATTDWPIVFVKELTGQSETPNGNGYNGASWWSARQCLLKEISHHHFKVLIICHTQFSRIPNDLNIGITPTCLDFNSIAVPSNVKHLVDKNQIHIASKYYYEQLFSLDFHKWAQKAWFEELDSILETLSIPHIIHLYCFGLNQSNHYKFNQGKTCLNILKDSWVKAGDENTTTRNHMTQDQNQIFAKNLAKIVKNYEDYPKVEHFKLFE